MEMLQLDSFGHHENNGFDDLLKETFGNQEQQKEEEE